jgi:hypothetical protein
MPLAFMAFIFFYHFEVNLRLAAAAPGRTAGPATVR